MNGDGKVNQLDTTSITQSALPGTNVTCGGVYATAFSCGSSQSSPLTPANSISFDTISYFKDDGIVVPGIPLTKKRDVFVETLMEKIVVMDSEMVDMRTELRATTTELRAKDVQLEAKDKLHDQKFEETKSSSPANILFDVSVSVAAVIICGAAVLLIQKRRS